MSQPKLQQKIIVKYILTPLIICSFIFNPVNGEENTANTLEDENSMFQDILGTLSNYLDYLFETWVEIKNKDGEFSFQMPQLQEGIFPGPIGTFPELNINSELQRLNIEALSLLTLPLIKQDTSNNFETPEIPTINRTVVNITEQGGFTRPYLPPLRWNADGRLGLDSNASYITLLRPESLNKPFSLSAPGPHIIDRDEYRLPIEMLLPGMPGSLAFGSLCESTKKEDGERRNPYACGENNADDCYDLTMVAQYRHHGKDFLRLNKEDRVVGIPLSIRVSNPKTPQARIEEVKPGGPQYSKSRSGYLFEVITPNDGRLMVARRAFDPLMWQHTATNKTIIGSYDIVYAVSPPEAEPCDVTHWGELYPITHAPYDNRVNERYLFAKLPFREPSGEIIPDGVDIKGTYPWMDKEAKMLVMQTYAGHLFPLYPFTKNNLSRYPTRCVAHDECNPDSIADSDNSKDSLFAVVGGWTQGKIVLFDGQLNNIDFRLGFSDRDQSYLSLYQPGTGSTLDENHEVRVGAVRGSSGGKITPLFDEQGTQIDTLRLGNLSFQDSIENRLNYLENIKPLMFQDVVWHMSSGSGTVELAFDDYLNPDGFIVSNMVAHLDHTTSNWSRMKYYDGWDQKSMSFSGQVRVQNSATALPEHWIIPRYGRVHNGRLEPVANGGIRGKGLWLGGDNDSRIEYTIPEQPQSVISRDWYYGLFIDPRFTDDDQERVLVSWPDGSSLSLLGLHSILLKNEEGIMVARIELSTELTEKSWQHIGLQVYPFDDKGISNKLTLYVDGFPDWHSENPYSNSTVLIENLHEHNFRPTVGTLRVGKGSTGLNFRGWIDEFKVFANTPNFEVACNYAHGTMIALTEAANETWMQESSQHLSTLHETISTALELYGQPTYSNYLCFKDYTDDNRAQLASIPDGTIALRDAFNFPEGPLYHDAPRPDSSNNKFCLSCHFHGAEGGLSIDALTLSSVDAKYDHRRQPMQSPPRVSGVIPANWLVETSPTQSITSEAGQLIDEWILPSSEGKQAEIRNLVFANATGDPIAIIKEGENEVNILDPENSEIALVKANVNGLVRRVEFNINGSNKQSLQVPFTFGISGLSNGLNTIEVAAYLDDEGLEASTVRQYSFQIEFLTGNL